MKQSKPDWTYYNASQDQLSWTAIPTGPIHIDRILRGKTECWLTPRTCGQQKLPRRIIITDWSLRYQPPFILNEFREWLSDYLSEGFEIYQLNQEDQQITVQALKTTADFKPHDIPMTLPAGVSAKTLAAEQHQIPAGELLELDYYNNIYFFYIPAIVQLDSAHEDASSFLDNRKKVMHLYDVSEYTKYLKEDVIDFLNRNKPDILLLASSELLNGEWQSIVKFIIDNNIGVSIQLDNANHLNQINQLGIGQNIVSLTADKSGGTIPLTSLHDLFLRLPNLAILSVPVDNKNLQKSTSLPIEQFSKFFKNFSTITFKKNKWYLEKSSIPHIDSTNRVSAAPDTIDDEKFDFSSLQSCKRLEIDDDVFTADQWKQLLANPLPNIKQLTFPKMSVMDIDPILDFTEIDYCEVIDLSQLQGVTLTDALKLIPRLPPKLKRLSLPFITIDSDEKISDLLKLLQYETIDLSLLQRLTSTHLISLIDNITVTVKKILLPHDIIFKSEDNDKLFSAFQNLTVKPEISARPWNGALLNNIIQTIYSNSSGLILPPAIIDKHEKLDFSTLRRCKKIDLKHLKQFTGEQLKALIDHFPPNLELITMPAVVIDSDNIPNFSVLEHCETMDLSHLIGINGRVMAEVTETLPNKLKHLRLPKISFGKDEIILTFSQLKDCETLTFIESQQLTCNQMMQFMSHLPPNIKSLSLNNIIVTDEGKIDFSILRQYATLEKIQLSNCNWLTEEHLNQIFNSPPPQLKYISDRKFSSEHEKEKIKKSLIKSKKSDTSDNVRSRYIPKPPKSFSYTNDNVTMSQSNIIQKLSQYWALKDDFKDKLLIPKIQDGFCAVLSEFQISYLDEHGLDAWIYFIGNIISWDGSKKSLSKKQSTNLKEISDFYKSYNGEDNGILISDNLIEILEENFLKRENSSPARLLISNGFHRCSLLLKDNIWYFYDPNFINGIPKLFKYNDLKNLTTKIQEQLGSTLLLVSEHEILFHPIKDYISLAKNGGLLILFEDRNLNKDIQLQGKELPPTTLISLFSLSTKNKPTWYYGLQNEKYRIFCLQSLQKLYEHSIKDFVYGCRRSTQRLTLLDTFEIKKILESIDCSPELFNAIMTTLPEYPACIDVEDEKSETQSYIPKDIFHRWRKSKQKPHNSQQGLISHVFDKTCNGKNLLLKATNEPSAVTFLDQLKQQARQNNTPCFVINTFDELRCYISAVEITNPSENQSDYHVHIKKSPASALHDFLNQYQNESPLIVIRWTNFSAEEVIQSNTILDKERLADGIPVPKGASIISLVDDTSYQGVDFLSRHHEKHTINLPEAESNSTLDLIEEIELPEETGASGDARPWIIDLYNSPDWKSILLGQLKLSQQGLTFTSGSLLHALTAQIEKIVICNGPWDLSDFREFWQDCLIYRQIKLYGATFDIPEQIKFQKSAGYHFTDKLMDITFHQVNSASSNYNYQLNPGNFHECFLRYTINEDQTLETLPGHFETARQNSKTELHFYVTHELSSAQWARLFDEAKANDLSIKFTLAPTVKLPEELAAHAPIIQYSQMEEKESEPPELHQFINEYQSLPAVGCHLIFSDDIAATQAALASRINIDKIVNVSEYQLNDLFYNYQRVNHSQTGQHENLFNFMTRPSDIWLALQEGETVLLQGKFSQQIIEKIAELTTDDPGIRHGDKFEPLNGRLLLLPDDEQGWHFYHNPLRCTVSQQDKELLLEIKDENLSEHSYLEWLAISRDSKKVKGSPVPSHSLSTENIIDIDLTEAASEKFYQQRVESLQTALHDYPYVFISGETAVGKSSFMRSLGERDDTRVYHNVKSWAAAKPSSAEETLILFIDEANMESTDWSQFEGLFNNPPSLLFDGHYYKLTEQHKVAFAGNPENYGGARKTPKLFTDYPNMIEFTELPDACLYQNIIRPILLQSHQDIAETEEKAENLSKIFLEIYRYVKRIDTQLISPRELQMMLMIFQARSYPADPTERAMDCAYSVAHSCLTKTERNSFTDWFKTEFDYTVPLPEVEIDMPDGFILTPTFYRAKQKIDDILSVRAFKQDTQKDNAPDIVQYGGLSTLVLEGPSGIGKSHFVRSILKAKGFTQASLNKDYSGNVDSKIKKFYYLPASANYQLKVDTLLRAFDEGAVVIIDEINTLPPSLERITNCLMMGEHPYTKKRPNRSGFTLLGTQNSIAQGARQAKTLAGRRRIFHEDLTGYSPDDIINILQKQHGLNYRLSLEITRQYFAEMHLAEKKLVDSMPCPRELFYAIDNGLLTNLKEATELSTPQSNKELTDLELSNLKVAILSKFNSYINSYLNWKATFFNRGASQTKKLLTEIKDKIEKAFGYKEIRTLLIQQVQMILSKEEMEELRKQFNIKPDEQIDTYEASQRLSRDCSNLLWEALRETEPFSHSMDPSLSSSYAMR
jgi:hypothetical protein